MDNTHMCVIYLLYAITISFKQINFGNIDGREKIIKFVIYEVFHYHFWFNLFVYFLF
jgi:hypothetical protein